MPWIDLEKLLEPIAAGEPAGPDLDFDPAFIALEQVVRGKEERRMGSAIIAAVPPDYQKAYEQALALLGRSKDLRVAAHLVRALVDRAHFEGLGEGLVLTRALLERYWQGVHPQLEAAEGNDSTRRASALSMLAAPTMLAALRSAPLLRSKVVGPITLRQVLGTSGEGGAGPEGLSAAAIDVAFDEEGQASLTSLLATLESSLREVSGIDAAFAEGVAPGTGRVMSDTPDPRWPDLAPLLRLLQQAVKAVATRVERKRVTAPGAGSTPGIEGDGMNPGEERPPTLPGEIHSREDVIRALDQLCRYYERNEPTSPLPLLLRRCKRLVSMNFVEIMQDLAPDAVSQVERVTGKAEKTEKK